MILHFALASQMTVPKAPPPLPDFQCLPKTLKSFVKIPFQQDHAVCIGTSSLLLVHLPHTQTLPLLSFKTQLKLHFLQPFLVPSGLSPLSPSRPLTQITQGSPWIIFLPKTVSTFLYSRHSRLHIAKMQTLGTREQMKAERWAVNGKRPRDASS